MPNSQTESTFYQVDPEQDGANLDGPDLDVLLLNTVMDNIRSMSAGVQKTMLKSIITSLLDHSKPLYRSADISLFFNHCLQRPVIGRALKKNNLLSYDIISSFRKDNVRALLILLQNPVFSAQSTYTVFAHVLQNVTTLANGDHQLLVHWFRSLEPDRLGSVVR